MIDVPAIPRLGAVPPALAGLNADEVPGKTFNEWISCYESHLPGDGVEVTSLSLL